MKEGEIVVFDFWVDDFKGNKSTKPLGGRIKNFFF